MGNIYGEIVEKTNNFYIQTLPSVLLINVHALTARLSGEPRLLCLEMYEKKCSLKEVISRRLERVLPGLWTTWIWAVHGQYLRSNLREIKQLVYPDPSQRTKYQCALAQSGLESGTSSPLPFKMWQEMFFEIAKSTIIGKSTSRAINCPNLSCWWVIFMEKS